MLLKAVTSIMRQQHAGPPGRL